MLKTILVLACLAGSTLGQSRHNDDFDVQKTQPISLDDDVKTFDTGRSDLPRQLHGGSYRRREDENFSIFRADPIFSGGKPQVNDNPYAIRRGQSQPTTATFRRQQGDSDFSSSSTLSGRPQVSSAIYRTGQRSQLEDLDVQRPLAQPLFIEEGKNFDLNNNVNRGQVLTSSSSVGRRRGGDQISANYRPRSGDDDSYIYRTSQIRPQIQPLRPIQGQDRPRYPSSSSLFDSQLENQKPIDEFRPRSESLSLTRPRPSRVEDFDRPVSGPTPGRTFGPSSYPKANPDLFQHPI